MDNGRYDLVAALLGSNRELRDVLQSKGYDVDLPRVRWRHMYVRLLHVSAKRL